MRDVVAITDSARPSAITRALVSLSVLRNFNPSRSPSGFGVRHLGRLLKDCFYRISGSDENWSERAYSYDGCWKVVIVNAMWFQDLYIFDLSTMSNSTTSVATQEGEINFSAYNSAGWRKVVEHVHQTATLSEWHRTHPRHQIYAKGRQIDLGHVRNPASQLVQIESEPTTISACEERL